MYWILIWKFEPFIDTVLAFFFTVLNCISTIAYTSLTVRRYCTYLRIQCSSYCRISALFSLESKCLHLYILYLFLIPVKSKTLNQLNLFNRLLKITILWFSIWDPHPDRTLHFASIVMWYQNVLAVVFNCFYRIDLSWENTVKEKDLTHRASPFSCTRVKQHDNHILWTLLQMQ